MASMVAKSSSSCCSSQVSPLHPVQEKGSRNKRKFRADPPLGDPSKVMTSPQNECSGYEFSAEKFEATPIHGCDLCGINQDNSDGLILDLGLSSGIGSSEVGTSQSREELESEESHEADWSDLTESQLEELVLSNLDAIFKSAIKKIVACGYTEDVATKAVLRSGLCYGCKDTVSNIVDNTLAFLRNGRVIDPSREYCFEDLQQLEKYILAEMVCVLREVRPFFSTGDAMWCLLISDMNVSHACAMDGDPLSSFAADGASNGTSSISSQPQMKAEAKCSELILPNPCKLEPSVPCSHTTSQPSVLEEKFIVNRKVHSNSTKREYILRQKSLHLEKGFRTYGPKGSRTGKLSSLILDKKLKSVSDSALKINNASLRLSKVMGIDMPQDNGSQSLSINPGSSPPASSNLESSSTTCSLPKTNVPSTLASVNIPSTLPALNASPVLAATDTELSLSLPAKIHSTSASIDCNTEEPNCSFAGIQYDKSLAQWVPRDKKDEMIMKLVPAVRELQNQLQEWTEWANQKVMQAARRLSKDKAELKSLRLEREEVERLKKEKQTLEENTMKKLTEMENALGKASGQVERANSAVRRLEVENAALRQEMEAAKLRAAESAASCQEVSKREKMTLMKFQSWEKQKTLLQEELAAEKRKVAQQLQDLEQAKKLQKQHEKYKDDIQGLEKEIYQLRLKTDASKIAALRRGISESYASRLTDAKNSTAQKEFATPYYSVMEAADFHEYSVIGSVKRERECVMCLSEEMSVVFLPCAHQVVCTTCNELHEKQGMKDCPSCRTPIQRRVPVCYARS
ncbi:hypothetical protein GH714_002663 [Hevea brasiliensis]|uniref:RING-type domain-containing protein n=1 Tax=Hevea brasiliensis TaxID=3981 RepID=A0A6A6KH86_HEVBR|nr:hypothetical protein GH714_002663 [Hevea brasiliensis]